jgi:DNA-binding protein H-NS
VALEMTITAGQLLSTLTTVGAAAYTLYKLSILVSKNIQEKASREAKESEVIEALQETVQNLSEAFNVMRNRLSDIEKEVSYLNGILDRSKK